MQASMELHLRHGAVVGGAEVLSIHGWMTWLLL